MKESTLHGRSCAPYWIGALLAFSSATVGCSDDASGTDRDTGRDADAAPTQDAGSGQDARTGMDADAGPSNDSGVPDLDAALVDGAMDFLDADLDGAEADGSDASDGAGDGGLVLASLEALQVGRFGGDLRAQIAAAGAENDVVGLLIELLNDQHQSLGAAQFVPLAQIITDAQGSGYGVLQGAFARHADVAFARVTVVDELDRHSAPREIAITSQAVAAEGGSCDRTLIANRCAEGLGCKGEPATCQAGVAPTLTRAGYFVDALGSRILIEGSDPDLDANGYRVQFFDASDDPIAINVDTDESTPAVAEYTYTIPDQSEEAFFVVQIPSQDFVDQVASIRVTVRDDAERESETITAPRGPAPERGEGASCDPTGFNRCSDGNVCADLGDQDRCTPAEQARSSACQAALVLNPSAGTTRVRGSLRSSLWDPPSGCSFGQGQTNQPDRVVKLVLASAAAKVTLSTDHPYTTFDTELYLLSSCNEAPRSAWCVADQAPGVPKAILQLTNLEPGEYYVIVESFSSSTDTVGDTFELTVALE